MKIYAVCYNSEDEFDELYTSKEEAIEEAKSISGFILVYNLDKEKEKLEYEEEINISRNKR